MLHETIGSKLSLSAKRNDRLVVSGTSPRSCGVIAAKGKDKEKADGLWSKNAWTVGLDQTRIVFSAAR